MVITDMEEPDVKWCLEIVRDIMNWPIARPFEELVGGESMANPGYRTVVKKQMDLRTVSEKLKGGKYTEVNEFVDDICLLEKNAIVYNGKNSIVAYFAGDIAKYVRKKMSEKSASGDEWFKTLALANAELRELMMDVPSGVHGTQS